MQHKKQGFDIVFFILIVAFVKSNCFIGIDSKNKISGIFRSEKANEIIVLADNNTFLLKRIKNKSFDVVNPMCEVLAKGTWQLIPGNILKLNNEVDFDKLNIDFKTENLGSKDSLYFKIILPNEDAFFPGRFKYIINFRYGGRNLYSNSNVIALAKKNFIIYNSNSFEIIVQDVSPNCATNLKCFQRVYFTLLKDYLLDLNFNSFTFRCNEFNQCFVEQMDINNELLLLNANTIFWKGYEYHKEL